MNTYKRWLVVLLAGLLLTTAAAEELWETPPGRARIFNALVDIFEDNYWDPAYRDWEEWSSVYYDQAVEADSRSAFDSTLRRMVGELGDDHSRFVGIRTAPPPSLGEEPVGNLGMGFRHSFVAGNGLVVERVFPNTPAAEVGLHRSDVISHVNGQDIRKLSSSSEANGALGEAIDSGFVNLRVRRKAVTLALELEPQVIDFSSVQGLPQGEMLADNIGYIYLPTFQGEGVAREVHRLLNELNEQGAQSMVLDLRDNLGGRLGELGLVLGAFIEGPWVEAMSRDAIVWRSTYRLDDGRGSNVLESPDGSPFAGDTLATPAQFSGPLSVIVSRRNSSAGEVAALVLQELERATIVGEQTEGNVEAIQSFDLPDGSQVYVAVANLQGTSGRDYSTGVTPDIPVNSSLQDLARGFDAPVAEAVRALKELPFTPGKYF